jgi:hypothetical protein
MCDDIVLDSPPRCAGTIVEEKDGYRSPQFARISSLTVSKKLAGSASANQVGSATSDHEHRFRIERADAPHLI